MMRFLRKYWPELLLAALIVPLAFAAQHIYERSLSGTFTLDSELVNDENMAFLAENWEKLGLSEPIQHEDTSWYMMMDFSCQDCVIGVYVNRGADYGRVVDLHEDALFGIASYTKATAGMYDIRITHCTSEFGFTFYGTSRNASTKVFDDWFSEKLEMAKT